MTGPARLRGGPVTCALSDLARRVGGRLLAGDPRLVVHGVAADTRAIDPEDLFCAIRGERTDAHTLLPEAFAAGAAAVLVDRMPGDRWNLDAVPAGRGIIHVPAVIPAMGRIAAAHIADLSPRLTVVGITGSVGKTGTRALVQAALGTEAVLAAVQSFNTEVSLPLVCLRAGPQHRFAVLELAMRGPGQIAYLADICRPRVGVLTVIGESHLELLGSVEAIMAAKGELLRALPRDGAAVLNADDPRQAAMAPWSPAPVVWYGLSPSADVSARDVRVSPEGSSFVARFQGSGRELPVRLRLLGGHHVRNALAALTVAERQGVPVREAAQRVGEVPPEPGRMCLRPAGGLYVLDDTFNAAPQSVVAALQALAELAPAGLRAAVLGDMLELGPASADGHRRVGRAAAEAGLSWLVTVGTEARRIAEGAAAGGLDPRCIRSVADRDEAIAALPERLAGAPHGLVVLVKASHAMGLDAVADALVARG